MISPALKRALSYLILGQKGGHNRVEIIELLKERPYNVNQLAEILNLNYRTVKHHIDALLKHELITTSKTGGYGEVYFLTPALEENLELFDDIKSKLLDVTSSPRLFQTLVEQTDDAVVVLDREGTVIFWNQSAKSLWGYDRRDVLGSSLPVFGDSGFLRKNQMAVLDGKQVIGVETKAVRKDGQEIDVTVTVDAIRNEDDELIGFSIISMDITKHKKAEQQIHLANEKLNHLLSASSAVIYTCETSGDYGTTFISDNVTRLLGYDVRDFLENSSFWMEGVHPDDAESLREQIQSVFDKGTHACEYRIRNSDGNYVWVRDEMRLVRDEDGEPLEIVGYMVDISDIKEYEEKLQREMHLLNTLMDSTSAMMAYLDEDFNFVKVNSAYAERSGHAAKDLIGKNHFDLFPSQENLSLFEKVRETGKSVVFLDKPFVYPDRPNEETYWDWSFSPVDDSLGHRMGYVLVLFETTSRKEMEAALEESERKCRLLYETMEEGVVFQDSSGAITQANQAAERILGLTLDQMQGRTSTDPRWKAIREDGSDFPGDEHPSMKALRTGDIVKDVIMGIYNPKTDSKVWINITAVPQFVQGEDSPHEVFTTFRIVPEP